uniref:F-box associated beta-propeller type 1 domain-containing protein n=1 Tax=Fagus sylvatica TaxID=28930 RepID=A0A2N9F4E5_FAGSY
MSHNVNNIELYALYNDDDDDFTEHTMFDFPLKPLNSKRLFCAMALVGICNGLVDPNILKERPKVEVYSLSTGVWRIITTALPPICSLNLIRGPERQAFVNGAVHWFAFSGTGGVKLDPFVLVFDFGDEVFRDIPLPKLPDYSPQECWNQLCAYGNSIAYFQTEFVVSRHLDIWVMKEYGVASSWT